MASTVYVYGMRLRGFSLGCQPMQGLIERQDDPTGKYHDLLVYERKLTDKELADYELDSLTEPKQKYIEWELENLPGVYDKPRCDEFIDRQTLTHVICNVDCPEDIDHDVFVRVVQEIADSLDLFPWFRGRIEATPGEGEKGASRK